jgi:hypothetical protein
MKPEIEKATSVLVGKSLWKCTRAADLGSFHFGAHRQVRTFRGDTVEVGDYALHVQCAWRIVQKDQIVVGSRDLYYPADYIEGEEVPAAFEWDRDPNRRDKLLSSFFENGTRQFTVRAVDVGPASSLYIALSEDHSLDLFPYDSLKVEHWRLFEPDKDHPHFVLVGSGIET